MRPLEQDAGPRRGRFDAANTPDPHPDPGSGAALGLTLFLASLAMLFVAAAAAFLWTRLHGEAWRAGLAREQLVGLGAASVCLLAADAWVARARRATRAPKTLRGALFWALVAGLLYAAVQGWNWLVLAPLLRGERALEAFTFVVLTGLHAAHVLGGLAYLAFLIRRRAAPTPTELRLTARYWRFLTCVWAALLVVLLVS